MQSITGDHSEKGAGLFAVQLLYHTGGWLEDFSGGQ